MSRKPKRTQKKRDSDKPQDPWSASTDSGNNGPPPPPPEDGG